MRSTTQRQQHCDSVRLVGRFAEDPLAIYDDSVPTDHERPGICRGDRLRLGPRKTLHVLGWALAVQVRLVDIGRRHDGIEAQLAEHVCPPW